MLHIKLKYLMRQFIFTVFSKTLIPDAPGFNVSYIVFLLILDYQIISRNKNVQKIDVSFPCASYVKIVLLWSLLIQELGTQYLISSLQLQTQLMFPIFYSKHFIINSNRTPYFPNVIFSLKHF